MLQHNYKFMTMVQSVHNDMVQYGTYTLIFGPNGPLKWKNFDVILRRTFKDSLEALKNSHV